MHHTLETIITTDPRGGSRPGRPCQRRRDDKSPRAPTWERASPRNTGPAPPEPSHPLTNTVAPKHKDRDELFSPARHIWNCSWPRRLDRPIWQSDQPHQALRRYESLPDADLAAEADLRTNPGPAGEEFSRVKGLCRFCARRDTCVYPKHEGGVWHCTEFE